MHEVNPNLVRKEILDQLKSHLLRHTPHPGTEIDNISKAYEYAVIPPGKLFRPLLAWAIFQDLSNDFQKISTENLFRLCSFLEIHHAYTLVHDDLPCMDDDPIRRGKPSTHAKYGVWKALLVGDGLISVSYSLISQIKSNRTLELLKFSTWALGPKGLIQGQVMDLSGAMKFNFNNIIKTHQLKTARLIQTALIGGFLICNERKYKEVSDYRVFLDLYKLGNSLGICFQFFDDLTEFKEKELSEHENEVNPWKNFSAEILKTLTHELNKIEVVTEKYDLSHLKSILTDYFQKIFSTVNDNKEIIDDHFRKFGKDYEILIPMMSLLKRVC